MSYTGGLFGGAPSPTLFQGNATMQAPGLMGTAMPVPRLSIEQLMALFQPPKSGALPPVGEGGLLRMFASPQVLAAEEEKKKKDAEAAAAAPGPTWDYGQGGNTGRKGAYVAPDGDGKLEPRRYTLHEGEVVANPELVSMMGGPGPLMHLNRLAYLAARRRGGSGLLG